MAKNEGLLEEDQTISRCSTYQRATKEPSIEATASASAAAPNILSGRPQSKTNTTIIVTTISHTVLAPLYVTGSSGSIHLI
jgi:hypothetical protein